VILKPSPLAPHVCARYVQLIAPIFPPGVFQVAQGGAHLARTLAFDSRIRSVVFTGSFSAGRALLAELAALDPAKDVALELGGKNAAIVLRDADFFRAASSIAEATCLTAGQRCNATARILVEASVLSAFLRDLTPAFLPYQPNWPADESTKLGPLTTIPGNVDDLFSGTTEEQTKAATRIVQTLGTIIPGGSVAAQAANVADFAQSLATSNGVSFSDEDRARRIKARFTKYKGELDTIHGKTQQPTGKKGKDGKPATKADPKIQAAKWAAMTDRLRADLAPASPELRAIVLESIQAPEEVKQRVAKKFKTTAPTPAP
jgi:hypothetical protein